MSSFIIGNTDGQETVGIWLRYYSNDDLIKLVKKSKLKRRTDTIERVVISEYDKNTNEVYLEFWFKSLLDSIRKKNRYNVFHIKTKINPYWVCEGDLGKGLNL